MSIVYGPVPSWRMGRSLGIDLLSTDVKTCSFDCVYCQLGRTACKQWTRQDFISLECMRQELEQIKDVKADYATFSGVGEPTLAKNLGKALDIVRELIRIPIAVLTNSTLLTDKNVRRELCGADVVVAKLDAPDNHLFKEINRPVFNCSVQKVVDGISSFRAIFKGKLAIQMMFIEANRNRAPDLVKIVQWIAPDEVQLNTPLRPSPVNPLSEEEMLLIRSHFAGLSNVLTVYEAARPVVTPVNREQTFRRRPETPRHK